MSEEQEYKKPEPKFKVDDKVKIARAGDATESPFWSKSMDQTMNLVGKVIEVCPTMNADPQRFNYMVTIDSDKRPLTFLYIEKSLELIKPDEQKPKKQRTKPDEK